MARVENVRGTPTTSPEKTDRRRSVEKHADLSNKKRSRRILCHLNNTSRPDLNALCPLERNNTFCLRLLRPSLDTSAHGELVSRIIADVLNIPKPVGDPLEELDKPFPGLSQVALRDIAVLDIAERVATSERAKKALGLSESFWDL